MNDYEFTFYNLNSGDTQKFICSAANHVCAWNEAIEYRNQYFENPSQWVFKNCEEISKTT